MTESHVESWALGSQPGDKAVRQEEATSLAEVRLMAYS